MDAVSKGDSRREKRASGEEADLTYDLHAETVEAPCRRGLRSSRRAPQAL